MEGYAYRQYEEAAEALRARLGGFAPRVLLILGSGLRQREDYAGIERLLGISMVPFLKDFLTN